MDRLAILVGVLLLGLIVFDINRGKTAAQGPPVVRADEPIGFWFVITCKIVMALTLIIGGIYWLLKSNAAIIP